MSVSDVKNAFTRVVADGKLDVKDVDTVLSSAGSISADEEKALKAEADKYVGITDSAAKAKLREKLGEVASLRTEAARINRNVQMKAAGLSADVKARLEPGKATTTFGGSAIPEAVKAVVNKALSTGALAYDVREMKADPVYDTSHGDPEVTLDGKYNPYAQEQRATDTLAFGHTELTPAKVKADMETVQSFNVLKGYKTVNGNQVAEFEKVSMKGNGKITELYDEASWPDTLARGQGGQKYASNFAILADGSLHCVPASRRTSSEPWRILTTASLGRGKQMLFNGHLHMENGVVTYVGMSGRLCKQQAKGEAKFVDPVEIIKAWGFQVAPGLKVTQEG
jgi:ElaB/YqjD/DUF883 family membrane-anchored ribosome-binding protein